MESAERRAFEERLLAERLMPVAYTYQNATTARDPSERFGQWMYLYEVTLKSLASLAWARSRAIGNQPPELLFFVRDSFQQASQGHWAQLLSACRNHLKQNNDDWARALDRLMRKKLNGESVLYLNRTVAALLGQSEPNVTSIRLNELMELMTPLRNKTTGHGAPRRHFYEDVNPHLERVLVDLLMDLDRFLDSDLLYVELVTEQGDEASVEGLRLHGPTRRPWRGTVPAAPWLQPHMLYALQLGEDGNEIHPLDPLLIWDDRNDNVCVYNAYVDSRQQFEYLSYARGEPLHRRGRSFESAFGLPAVTPQVVPGGPLRLWSDKGVALYPTTTPLVGQNPIYNALVKFRRKFGQSQLSSFFALIGDWGLGKSRIGFELFAESFGHVERWLLNEDEYVLPNSDGRILAPGLADGVLPLFVRYDLVCDDELYANNWIPRVALEALRMIVEQTARGGVPSALLADVHAALQAKGIDLEEIEAILNTDREEVERLEAVLQRLRPHGIEHLWVVVDEIETVTDFQRRGLPDDGQEPVAAEFLTLVADVFRHENYRADHPAYANVHFLLLCSEGMRDKLEIGPSRRRDDVMTLTPNRMSDVVRYVTYLRERAATEGQSVDYPEGTVEAAFMASNRNFGWLNVIMSSVHEAYQRYRTDGKAVSAAELIEEFARSEARARYVFDNSGLDLLQGITGANRSLVNRLVFGQLPLLVGRAVTPEQADELQQARLPGLSGSVFAELMQVHIDQKTLADELSSPGVGARLVQETAGDQYEFYGTRLSISALLSAFRAFSVTAKEGDILVYTDPGEFAAQLKSLYPEPNIEQAADALHRVFQNAQVGDRRFLAASFALLQRVDKLLSQDTQRTTFFRNPGDEALVERHEREVGASERRRQQAICGGFARLLDDDLGQLNSARHIQSSASVEFTSAFQSPRMDGLRVTSEGRMVVVYCQNPDQLAADLEVRLGHLPVHPIAVLLSPHLDPEMFHQAIARMPLVQRCVIVRRLNTLEEAFLLRYAGRGTVFTDQPLSDWTYSRIGAIREEWQRQINTWYETLEAFGYLLRPIWYSTRGLDRLAFYEAYRTMLIDDCSIDEIEQGLDAATFEQVRNACSKNVEPPVGRPRALPLLSEEPYRPTPPPAFGALLYELRQQASLNHLATRFFTAVSDDEMRNAPKPLEQILELLQALGLVTSQGNVYRTLNADLLHQYREAASAWLSGRCREIVDEIREVFPTPAEQIESGYLRYAQDALQSAERAIGQLDFRSLHSGPQLVSEMLRTLVAQIRDVETNLEEVCPAGVYRREGVNFECTPEQIRVYEARYNALSLWEKVNFLGWLKNTFAEQRTQVEDEIRRQLSDAQTMRTIAGHPFPVSALTVPLKTIERELATLTGSMVSLAGRLEVPGYPYEFRRYLLTDQYEDAWHRLRGLHQLVDRNHPDSLWAKFKTAHDRWQKTVRAFERAEAAWARFRAFMADAPESAWGGAERVRADYGAAEDMVKEGLAQAIDSQASSQGALALLDELVSEVNGYAEKIDGLGTHITSAHRDVERELKKLLNLDRLRALNTMLRALSQSEISPPEVARTYAETKRCYEDFNAAVNDRGLEIFDREERVTTWSLWQEIYRDLSVERYKIHPDHRRALDELAEMGVVEYTVRLCQ